MLELRNYRARLNRVVDGDTVWLDVDLGFRIQFTIDLRLAGVNAPELSTPAGVIAKAFVDEWFSAHPALLIQTKKDSKDNYGRYVATILDAASRDPETSLNQALLDSGNAVPYPAKKEVTT